MVENFFVHKQNTENPQKIWHELPDFLGNIESLIKEQKQNIGNFFNMALDIKWFDEWDRNGVKTVIWGNRKRV